MAGAARTLLRIVFFTAVLVLSTNSAYAQMASPTDKYEAATTQVVEALKSLDHTKNYFAGARTTVRLMEAASEGVPVYLFVRIETQDCEEWCPNAIFKVKVSSDSFVAFALLPRKSAWGDTWLRLCRICTKTQPLYFYGDKGSPKAIGFSPEGLIF